MYYGDKILVLLVEVIVVVLVLENGFNIRLVEVYDYDGVVVEWEFGWIVCIKEYLVKLMLVDDVFY